MNDVLLAMSGGTDSSASAMLLLEKDYKVRGITFKMWETGLKSCTEKESGCCNSETLLEAKSLADKLGFNHKIVDIRGEFEKYVINDFIDNFLSGKTPNPCVVCNNHIKWGVLLDEIRNTNSFYATGHYARIRKENGRFILYRSKDFKKDQTYFLWTLNQDQLSRTIFPLGDYTKDEVREIARKKGFQKIADKKESQEICFIPDNDYRRFLRDNVSDIDEKVQEGWFIDTDGNRLGKHKGFPFYTIGQRRGLNIALGYPAYVLSIDTKSNTIVVGSYDNLEKNKLRIKECNWIKYEKPPEGLEIEVKIRYNTPPVKGKLHYGHEFTELILYKPVYALTPGQSAVIYEEDDVVGGGIIV